MFTIRVVPPHWRKPADGGYDDTFLDVYYRSLWQHWRPGARAIAWCMMLASTPSRFGSSNGACRALNHPRRLYRAVLAHKLPGSRCEDFLWQPARKGIHRMLNPAAFPFSASPLKNKHLFADLCRREGLAHPETLASGAAPQEIAAFLDRHPALIVKPNFSSRGRGVEAWRRDTDGWHGPTGKVRLTTQMIERIRARLAAGDIVQRRLTAHPTIEGLSCGILPSLRIVTCRAEDGRPEATDAVLRLPAGGACPVDNFMAGGIACVVGADGRIERALMRCSPGFRRVDEHPAGNQKIVGAIVPDFDTALALAHRAHEALGEGFTVVGWDVGLTDQGPVLIEGNWNPGGETIQLPHGEGLAARRLGALFRHHLERLPAAAWRAAHPLQIEPI